MHCAYLYSINEAYAGAIFPHFILITFLSRRPVYNACMRIEFLQNFSTVCRKTRVFRK